MVGFGSVKCSGDGGFSLGDACSKFKRKNERLEFKKTLQVILGANLSTSKFPSIIDLD